MQAARPAGPSSSRHFRMYPWERSHIRMATAMPDRRLIAASGTESPKGIAGDGSPMRGCSFCTFAVTHRGSEYCSPSQARAEKWWQPSSRFVVSHSYAHVVHKASGDVSVAWCQSPSLKRTSTSFTPTSSAAVPWIRTTPLTVCPFLGWTIVTFGGKLRCSFATFTETHERSEYRSPSSDRAHTVCSPLSNVVVSHWYAHVDHEASWLVSTASFHTPCGSVGSMLTWTSSTRSPTSGSLAVPWTRTIPETISPPIGCAIATSGRWVPSGTLSTKYSATAFSE